MELPGETKGNIVQVIESSGKGYNLLHTQRRTSNLFGGLERCVLYFVFVRNFQSGINISPPILLKLYVDVY